MARQPTHFQLSSLPVLGLAAELRHTPHRISDSRHTDTEGKQDPFIEFEILVAAAPLIQEIESIDFQQNKEDGNGEQKNEKCVGVSAALASPPGDRPLPDTMDIRLHFAGLACTP
jgi:hypothetical protein